MFTIRMLVVASLSVLLVTGVHARDSKGDQPTLEKTKPSANRIDRSYFALPETGDTPLSGPTQRSLINSAEYWNLKRLDDNKKNFQPDQKVNPNKDAGQMKNFRAELTMVRAFAGSRSLRGRDPVWDRRTSSSDAGSRSSSKRVAGSTALLSEQC